VINDDLDFEAEAEKISAADPVLLGTPLPLGNTVKVDQTAEA
jgi:hypothetical protein